MKFLTTILTTTALIQGTLSYGITVWDQPGCKGTQKILPLHADSTFQELEFPFKSYMEHGWGQHEQRIQFWTYFDTVNKQCSGEGIYSTWAYNGEYFRSGKCYTIGDHPNLQGKSDVLKTAGCVKSVRNGHFAYWSARRDGY
ncbi:hypothetical protein BJX65DRAFT_310417 [Aspergillus insuetus]